MSYRWRSAMNVIFAICFLFSALPLASSATAADATPPAGMESPSLQDGDQTPPVEALPTQESTAAAPTGAATAEAPQPPGVPAQPTTSPSDVSASDESTDLTDLYVEKIWCEDNTRAGTTDFMFDTAPEISATSVSTCIAQAPTTTHPVISVSLINLDTWLDYTKVLDTSVSTQLNFFQIPVGSYIATETVNGMVEMSETFELTLDGRSKRLRIVNYIAETEHSGPSAEGQGGIYGYFLNCTAPDRSGDIEFMISDLFYGASMTTCEVSDVAGDLVIYSAQSATGPIDSGAGISVNMDPYGSGVFMSGSLDNGYYALGFQPEGSNTPVYSEIFVVANAITLVEINVYAEIVPSAMMVAWKDICVDPALAGQTRFFIHAESNDGISATASTECRYARESDGPFTITLTNTDTAAAQSDIITAQDGVVFWDLVAGIYTLTEEHNGQVATSDPFTIDTNQTYFTYIRNYIAEKDWVPSTENEGDVVNVNLIAYVCIDATRNGGAEFFHYANVSEEVVNFVSASDAGRTTSTAECRHATEADGFQFVMSPVGDVSAADAGPVSFMYWDEGWYATEDTIFTGQYVVTELTTGTSTATLDIVGYSNNIDFFAYQSAEPTETPTDPATPAVTPTDPGQPTVTATTPAQPTPGATASATETAKVTSLPTTGQGSSASSGSMSFMLLAGISLLILGSGVWIRSTQKSRR